MTDESERDPLIKALEARIANLEKENKDLVDENIRLAKLATTDSLTGLPNRAFIKEKRLHTTDDTSVILADLDKFKPINDTYGYDIGDKLLVWFGDILKRNVRPKADTVTRYGGDEFVIILNGADKKKAEEITANIIHELSESHFDTDHTSLMIEASFGVASSGGNSLVSLQELIKKADEEMYEHKKSKGNVK